MSSCSNTYGLNMPKSINFREVLHVLKSSCFLTPINFSLIELLAKLKKKKSEVVWGGLENWIRHPNCSS